MKEDKFWKRYWIGYAIVLAIIFSTFTILEYNLNQESNERTHQILSSYDDWNMLMLPHTVTPNNVSKELFGDYQNATPIGYAIDFPKMRGNITSWHTTWIVS